MSVLALPPGPFGCIVADPAWRFSNKASRGAAENHYKTLSVEEICRLPVADIAADDAHLYLWAPDAFFLDGSAALVARIWGFTPKQFICWRKVRDPIEPIISRALDLLTKGTFYQGRDSFIALDIELRGALQALADARKDRPQMGAGNYARHCFELLALCVKGKLGVPDGAHDILASFDAPRGEHSAKPDELFAMAERLSPGPRLEMFARKVRSGWSGWGDEYPQASAPVTQKAGDIVRLEESMISGAESSGVVNSKDAGTTAQPGAPFTPKEDPVSIFADPAPPENLKLGEFYVLPDGRAAKFTGTAKDWAFFSVTCGGDEAPGIQTVRLKFSDCLVTPKTDYDRAIECPDCKFDISEEAAKDAEACPYCATKAQT